MGAVLGAPRVGVATAPCWALELPPLVTGGAQHGATGNASEGSCSESSGTSAEDVRGDAPLLAPLPAAGAEGMPPAGLPRCRVIRG